MTFQLQLTIFKDFPVHTSPRLRRLKLATQVQRSAAHASRCCEGGHFDMDSECFGFDFGVGRVMPRGGGRNFGICEECSISTFHLCEQPLVG